MKETSTPVLIKTDRIIKRITGKIGWKDYLRLLEFCEVNNLNQMDLVGQAIIEFLDRQEK